MDEFILYINSGVDFGFNLDENTIIKFMLVKKFWR